MMDQNENEYDVIISGSGLVGRFLGVGLCIHGLKVALIDQKVFDKNILQTIDRRTTSISYGSKKLFEKLNLWSAIENHAQPIFNIKVFEFDSPCVLSYNAEDLGNFPMGYVVENAYILKALFNIDDKDLHQNGGILNNFSPNEIQSIEQRKSSLAIHLSSGDILKTALLIGADGKNSSLRDYAGISVTTHDYDQNALVIHVNHELPHKDTAYEIFLKEGPLAVLPLKSPENNGDQIPSSHTLHQSGIVWCRHKSHDFRTQSDDDLIRELQNIFPDFGQCTLASQRWVYSLSFLTVSTLISHRFALAGDAGHVMHPIAGQGVNLGWRDADCLIQLLSSAKKCGLDLGGDHLLLQYDQARKGDRLSLLWITDFLNNFYQKQSMPLKIARQSAFAILDWIKPIKRSLMRRAMGLF